MTQAIIIVKDTQNEPLQSEQCTDEYSCLTPLLGRSVLARQLDVIRSTGMYKIHLIPELSSEQLACIELSAPYRSDFVAMQSSDTLLFALQEMVTDMDLLLTSANLVLQKENLVRLLSSLADVSVMVDVDWYSLQERRFFEPLSQCQMAKTDERHDLMQIVDHAASSQEVQGLFIKAIKVRKEKISDLVSFCQSMAQNDSFVDLAGIIQALIGAGWEVKAVPVSQGWLPVESNKDVELYEQLQQMGQLTSFCDNILPVD